jgi:V8-like Glu-specific endopeptidase
VVVLCSLTIQATAQHQPSKLVKAKAAVPKVIYGTDDRIDVYQETDPQRLHWAASTCLLIDEDDVFDNGDGTHSINTRTNLVNGKPACETEPFGDQPTAGYCSGFVVGPDLIATAGHCYDDSDINFVRFVFGFVMENASTAVTTMPDENVYQGIEVVGRALTGNTLDYAVIRVDRPINVVGAQPFVMRREGVIARDTAIGVIGHPSGLPMKIAFGADTRVRNNSNEGFFIANLDTYGGNSGSPVINAETGILEGILVRGEIPDYRTTNGCFVSTTFSNNGGGGEEVSKTSTFADLVPLYSQGAITLSRSAYTCEDLLELQVVDYDLRGAGPLLVLLNTTGGDMESLLVNEVGASTGLFSGEMIVQQETPATDSGVLEVGEGDLITVSYEDEDILSGELLTVSDTAAVDCTPPLVLSAVTSHLTTCSVIIEVQTNEAVTVELEYGLSCDPTTNMQNNTLSTGHNIVLSELLPATTYFYALTVTDEGGNILVENNDGACYTFTTPATTQYFTEHFSDADQDLAFSSITFTPDDSAEAYTACITWAIDYPSNPQGDVILSLSDDSSERVVLNDGAQVFLYGMAYDEFFINSNGNITFDSSDNTFEESVENHLQLPRISAFFHDFDPEVLGQVSYRQFPNRVSVTFDSVPEYGETSENSFQMELFFDGTLRLTYLQMAARFGLAGLSPGLGTTCLTESDLSQLVGCEDEGANGITCSDNLLDDGGFERDMAVSDWDIAENDTTVILLCDAACAGDENMRSHSGQGWAVLGGNTSSESSGSLLQQVFIPEGRSASLQFYLRMPYAETTASFKVFVGTDLIFEKNDTNQNLFLDYQPIQLDLAKYADASMHEISFDYEKLGGRAMFYIDDVCLTVTAPKTPPGCAATNQTTTASPWGDLLFVALLLMALAGCSRIKAYAL